MTVEALISHPHPGTKRVNGRKIFDREANCLCRRGKATKTDRLTQTGFVVFWYEQFGRCGVIECIILAFPKLCRSELTFLDHPLMRLGGTFDFVLKVVAFGRQELRDLIDAPRTPGEAKPPGSIIY